MGSSCFVGRLEHYLRLTPQEREAVSRLEGEARYLRRGDLAKGMHDKGGELLIVDSGWMASCVLLADGSRQILQLHVPGDLVGLASTAYAESTSTLVALTDVRVCPFPRGALGRLFEAQPRVAGLFFSLAVMENIALCDRLVSIGRTSARARIAALLLDTAARLAVTGNATEDSLPFPLTQEDIGDATGLTAVHVNRMIRQLEEGKLIARGDGRFRLLDRQGLMKLAAFENRYARLELGWLPGSR